MADTEDQGEIDIIVETEVVDVDGDGVPDAVRETTTTLIDVDGDGIPDIVDVSTTTAIDVDGDGIPDIIETTSVTGVDVDGDGTFSEDEIAIDASIAVREDLVQGEADG